MEQSTDRFHSEADELVNKHNKRWTTKFNAVSGERVEKATLFYL